MSNQSSRSISTDNNLMRQPISTRAFRYCHARASGANPTAAARTAGYRHVNAAASWLESQPVINQLITKLVNGQGRSFIMSAEERARILAAIANDNTASNADRLRALQLLERIEETGLTKLGGTGITVSWDDTKE